MKKIKHHFLSCILILASFFLLAQQDVTSGNAYPELDSLLTILEKANEDTAKIVILDKLSHVCRKMLKYDHALDYAISASKIAKNTGNKKLISSALRKIGNIYLYKLIYEKAVEYYLTALELAEEANDKTLIGHTLNNLGNVYARMAELSNPQANYEKSLEFHLRAISTRKEANDYGNINNSYLNISNVYRGLGQQGKAVDYLLQTLTEYIRKSDNNGMDLALNNLGETYLDWGKNTEKKEYYKKAEAYFSERLDSYLKSELKMKRDPNKQNIPPSSRKGRVLIFLGEIYFLQKDLDKAIIFLKEGVLVAKDSKTSDILKNGALLLAKALNAKGDYKQALEYHKLYSNLKDTLLNEKSNKQIAEMNTKYDSEKKDKELIQKDAEISKQQAETEKQILQRNAFIIGFSLVLTLAFFIYRGYRQKKTANGLLEEKNCLIENQKKLVDIKNRKITDSINYAKRIQQAILPSEELIKSVLPDSFIFFRPKDIVSGDFYWFTEKVVKTKNGNGTENNPELITRNSKLIIAVADCTGHGVPGAFMSMIGNTLLNEIVNVKNISEPDQILIQLNKGIVSLLNQNNSGSDTQDDGMDITILTIDKKNNEIEFAGANHFSYLIKNAQLETLKGDVYSIGGMFGQEDINFSSQKIKIDKGNTLYLFTDGFIDQFGGEKNTKFLSGRFEQLLLSIQQNNLEEQHEKLIVSFDDWIGNNKQLDDVLVLGIRF